MKFIDFIFDTIFPKFCLNCGLEGQYICPDCFNIIKPNLFRICYKCDKRNPWGQTCDNCQQKTPLKGVIIANLWENDLLKKIVYEFKYRFIKELSKPLAKTLINYIKIDYKTLLNSDTIITFVPLHKKRLIWRGFNQGELLANELSNELNLPCLNLLIRQINTTPQAEIKNQVSRLNNIKQAFSLNPNISGLPSFKNKTIIIIDDICTTGATLEECAKTLKRLKPKQIWGLALARG